MGIGAACSGSSPNRANAALVQRTVPVVRFSSQPPIRPSRCALPSRSASRSGSPSFRQVQITPAKNGATRRSATPTASLPPVERGGAGPGDMLGAAGRQHPAGPGEQAVGRPRRGIGLQQGQAGQLGGPVADRVHVAGALVHHGEIGQRAAFVAQRPEDQHGVGDLVKQPEHSGRRGGRPDRFIRHAHAEHFREPGDDGAQPRPRGGVEVVVRRLPPDFRDTEPGARPVAQRQHRAGRGAAPRRDGGQPGRPAGVRSVPTGRFR